MPAGKAVGMRQGSEDCHRPWTVKCILKGAQENNRARKNRRQPQSGTAPTKPKKQALSEYGGNRQPVPTNKKITQP